MLIRIHHKDRVYAIEAPAGLGLSRQAWKTVLFINGTGENVVPVDFNRRDAGSGRC